MSPSYVERPDGDTEAFSSGLQRRARIYVAGHTGLVGSSLMRALTARGYETLITRTHAELDLTDQLAVRQFFAFEKPEYVFLAAARVGGIVANSTYPADFISSNLEVQNNVIRESQRTGVTRLLFLGSSCIYPSACPQPIKEDYLLTGPLELTNRPYAIAKIAGIEMCAAYNRQYGTQYLPVMPTNLFGPGDNYDLQTSHVLPALIRKMHEAKRDGLEEVVLWGTGKPRRELMHSDDLADACVFLMSLPDAVFRNLLQPGPAGAPLINIGIGEDLTIRELAELVKDVVGFCGRFRFDTTKPDGTFQKLLDVTRLTRLGWRAKIPLAEGLKQVYEDFRANAGAR